jgi:hypothetical protein
VSTTPVPDLKCVYCKQAVYWYEYTEVPACIWCYKNEAQLPVTV